MTTSSKTAVPPTTTSTHRRLRQVIQPARCAIQIVQAYVREQWEGARFREAVESSVPKGTEDLNLKAFDAGWGYFEEHYGVDAGGDATAAAEVVSPVA